MRFLLLSVLVLLIVSTVLAGVTSTTKTCTECPLKYDPVCAAPKDSTNEKDKKSFGNACVMEKYNCEKNEKLVVFSAGECPGSKSVRLQ